MPPVAPFPADRVILEPAARRQAIVDVIRGARQRLSLSLFRCNDKGILAELAAAVQRGVDVEVDPVTSNPRLMLTVDLDGYSRRLPLGDVISAPAAAQPEVVATVNAAEPVAAAREEDV